MGHLLVSFYFPERKKRKKKHKKYKIKTNQDIGDLFLQLFILIFQHITFLMI